MSLCFKARNSHVSEKSQYCTMIEAFFNFRQHLYRLVNLPASIAFLAASLKSLTIWGISSVLSRLGFVNCCTSLLASDLSVEDIGACPFG